MPTLRLLGEGSDRALDPWAKIVAINDGDPLVCSSITVTQLGAKSRSSHQLTRSATRTA